MSLERWKNYWISPQGECFQVEMGEHEPWAYDYMKNNHPQLNLKIRDAGAWLLAHGWALIMTDAWTGTLLRAPKMNEIQFKMLYDCYSDIPLFRGWTVRKIYEAAEKDNRDS